MSLIQAPDAPAVVAEPAIVVADPAAVVAVAAPAVADPAVPSAAAATPPAAVAPVRPDGVPDALWDAATGLKTTEALARLGELEAAETARTTGVPADAAGYKLTPTEPIIDPVTKQPIAFNAEDPLAKAATAWAHANGLPQAALSGLLTMFAGNEMAALAAHNAAIAAETTKLGAGSAARFAALSAGLTAHAGEDGAKAIMASLGTAAQVEALEKVLKAITGPSIGSPPVETKKTVGAGLSGLELLSALRAA